MKCPRCNKKPEVRFFPYCSYHCQEWGNLHAANMYLAELREKESVREEKQK